MKLELEAPEFERIVGEGNNTVSSKMYALTYYAPVKESYSRRDYTNYEFELLRFTCFDQIPYSKEEVNAYAEILVDKANEVLLGESQASIPNEVLEQTNSKVASLEVKRHTSDIIESLKPLPAHDPDYIDEPIIDEPMEYDSPVEGEVENSKEAEIAKEGTELPLGLRLLNQFTRAVIFTP